MQKNLFLLRLLMPLAAVLLITSCSKEKSIFETIPSDVEQVGTLRLKSIMQQAGCVFGGGEVRFAADGGAEMGERLENLVWLTAKIDSAGVADPDAFVWAAKGREAYLAIEIESKDEFAEATKGVIEWGSDMDGCLEGDLGGSVVLVTDRVAWIGSSRSENPAAQLGAFLKGADKESVADLTGIMQTLGSNALVNAAVCRTAYSKNTKQKSSVKVENTRLQSEWITLNCTVADNKLHAESNMIKADGTRVELEGLQPVNPAVLGYVPADCNMVFAAGVTPKFDWSILTGAIANTGDFQTQGMVAAVTPYLQSVDGTILVAAGPANERAYTELDPGNWHFILMARLPQNKINSILAMARTSMSAIGEKVPETSDGIMVIPQYGMNIYMGNVDGYFGIANFPFDANHQNSLAPVVGGKSGALIVDLPSLAIMGGNADSMGLKATMQFDGSTASGTLALTGTDQPILQAILDAIL